MDDRRESPIDLNAEEFSKAGHQLIDSIAAFLRTIAQQPVTRGKAPKELQQRFATTGLPEHGRPVEELLAKATELLFHHSLLNGHPKFLGYITSSAAPLGALADLLAAAVNPNVGAQILSPIATEMEKQTVRWLAEFIGVPPSCGGILVSGGNMANFTAFLAARTAKAPTIIKADGLTNLAAKLTIYCAQTTHTWVEKAAILFGHGSNAIRWIPTTAANQMDNALLEQAIQNDLQAGHQPFIVIGNAGDVSTGVVDNLSGIAAICRNYDLWFHIDGAYGIPAAVLPELKTMFAGIAEADSIALDPHKWLYSPLEAGCTLVKNPNHLLDTYSSHPVYYNFNYGDEDLTHNYYEYGLQNSRGFRALKVWLILQQVGRSGYIKMIAEDIRLSKLLFRLADEHAELEAVSQNLSITTLRYVPAGIDPQDENQAAYLNALNEALLNQLQQGGQVFLSNAVVRDQYCLRACIVNFRTSATDIAEIVAIIVADGRQMHQQFPTRPEPV